jgi:glyoxylase-like metal-dependent hydrolase (beta-lactamase superfamily II)
MPCLALMTALISSAIAQTPAGQVEDSPAWTRVLPGVWRSAGLPCAYALVEGDRAIIIGAGRGADLEMLRQQGASAIDFALLTHAHRDTAYRAQAWIDAGVAVRAPAASAPWLLPEEVAAYWERALPRPTPGREPPLRARSLNEWVYLIHPTGVRGIDCSLEPGEVLRWQSWRIETIATPGHTRDHVAYAATWLHSRIDFAPIIFCGDAIYAAGKIWSPYTTDWDHWQGEGLAAAAESCHRLAALDPQALLPEHGEPILKDTVAALEETTRRASEAAFLKSYERYTKE